MNQRANLIAQLDVERNVALGLQMQWNHWLTQSGQSILPFSVVKGQFVFCSFVAQASSLFHLIRMKGKLHLLSIDFELWRANDSGGMNAMASDKPLEGKMAIVTGASRGIGRAIALRLAQDGATLVLAARTESDLAKLASEIKSGGGKATIASGDLRDSGAPAALVDAALEAHGAIDIVVNNAGATKRGDFFELTDADWSDGFALKFLGAVRLTRAAWPHLKARRGSVLNIIGAGGRTPSAEFTIGGSVNGACLSFTKAVADIGIQNGVQVNAINPGRIKTDRFQQTLAAEAVQ